MRGTRSPKGGRRGYAGSEYKVKHSAGGIPVEAAIAALVLVFALK